MTPFLRERINLDGRMRQGRQEITQVVDVLDQKMAALDSSVNLQELNVLSVSTLLLFIVVCEPSLPFGTAYVYILIIPHPISDWIRCCWLMLSLEPKSRKWHRIWPMLFRPIRLVFWPTLATKRPLNFFWCVFSSLLWKWSPLSPDRPSVWCTNYWVTRKIGWRGTNHRVCKTWGGLYYHV